MAKRLENTKHNIFSGIIGQMLKIVTKFSIRTVVIYYFGAAYLGLDGLFMNVIAMLSLAEMGIGDAICFALYKPLADQDASSINAYMRFYKIVYLIIGTVVLCIGIFLIPLLGYIVNFDASIKINYHLVYILFLLNSVSTYWFGSYRQVLLIADQRMYEINRVNNFQVIIQFLMQIAVLSLLKNYYLYVAVMIVSNIAKNLFLFYDIGQKYPFINSESYIPLSKEKRTALAKNVYALSITKISSTIYTSSDNLVISIFIGTIIVGYYSNYSYIVSAITGLISIIFSSVTASIGNVNASLDSETLHEVFKKMLLINQWIYGYCFVCLWQLLTPFVRIWTGSDEYVLTELQVTFIVLMFLITGLNHTCTIFRAACGLFWQTRYRTIATALINVVLSVFLAIRIGLSGVFLGTIISYLVTTFIVDPRVLYHEIFHLSKSEFYIWFIKSLLSILIISVLCRTICSLIPLYGISGLIIQLAICTVVFNAIFVLMFWKDDRFLYFREIIARRGL